MSLAKVVGRGEPDGPDRSRSLASACPASDPHRESGAESLVRAAYRAVNCLAAGAEIARILRSEFTAYGYGFADDA
jgi:hypothetical protein